MHITHKKLPLHGSPLRLSVPPPSPANASAASPRPSYSVPASPRALASADSTTNAGWTTGEMAAAKGRSPNGHAHDARGHLPSPRSALPGSVRPSLQAGWPRAVTDSCAASPSARQRASPRDDRSPRTSSIGQRVASSSPLTSSAAAPIATAGPAPRTRMSPIRPPGSAPRATMLTPGRAMVAALPVTTKWAVALGDGLRHATAGSAARFTVACRDSAGRPLPAPDASALCLSVRLARSEVDDNPLPSVTVRPQSQPPPPLDVHTRAATRRLGRGRLCVPLRGHSADRERVVHALLTAATRLGRLPSAAI